MAKALLSVATETLLSKVISLANQRLSGLVEVKEDLQTLTKELEMIHAMQSDAEIKSTTNKIIEVWMKDLNDAATDADDLLDEFAYEVLSKKMLKEKEEKVRSFFSSSNPLLFRCKMVSRIKKIKLQIHKLYERAHEIGLRPVDIKSFSNDPRKVLLPPTTPFVDDSEIVGRDNEVSKIVSYLTSYSDDEKNLSVLGIVGTGGQGKTTLAQLLLKNDEVKENFEKIIWTCVSEDFDVNKILKDMLQSLTGQASELTNTQAIVNKLSKEIQGKRFLLVLDDVWNQDSQLWEGMHKSLKAIGGSKGSKIIVTTRSEEVVTIMSGSKFPMGALSAEESQKLFERLAFANERGEKNPQLVEIGKRIVAKCGGLPLALKTIGALMSSQRDELEWLKIEESRIWSTLSGVRSAIKLSFDHLPSLSLKHCFAYCSIFPKDSVIVKKDLIQQWMAHGWLNASRESETLEMEDVGNNYFKILLQSSLLQEAKFDAYDNLISCKMHDLVHDFVSEISKDHCLIAKVGELANDVKAVHLSIEIPYGSENLNISEQNFSRLRTLHLRGYASTENFLLHCKSKHLRVLIVDDMGMERLPISVAELKHLRYLGIPRTRIYDLPEFISKLYNLQTLRLPFVENFPKNFSRCVNLRHLHDREYFIFPDPHLFPGIGQLTSLRTWNSFAVSRDKGCQIKELYTLKHLEGRVRIVGLKNVANGGDARRGNLSGKRNIESLELVWSSVSAEEGLEIDNLPSSDLPSSDLLSSDESVLEGLEPHTCLKGLTIRDFMGASLPSWILRLRNLIRVELLDLKNCEEIPPFGHLRFLKILEIQGMCKVRCISNDFYGWPNLLSSNIISGQSPSVDVFPSLMELRFYNMSSLKDWSDMVPPPSFVSSSSSVKLFPNLENLRIDSCPCLTLLPKGLSALTSLESLTIHHCDKLVSAPDLSRLHSLKHLVILDCTELSALSHGIEPCNSLRSLKIRGPTSLMESLPPYLINLRELHLSLKENITNPVEPIYNPTSFSILEKHCLDGMMSQLKSLPEQIQNFTAMRVLKLAGFNGFESLPEWLGKLHSLEILQLFHCNSLTSFPSMEVMQEGLTNLTFLEIRGCPILKQRCQKETGAEWQKIAHIPKIIVEGSSI